MQCPPLFYLKKHYKTFGNADSFSYIYIIINKQKQNNMISLETNKTQLKCHTPLIFDYDDEQPEVICKGDILDLVKRDSWENGGDWYQIIHGIFGGTEVQLDVVQIAKHFSLL